MPTVIGALRSGVSSQLLDSKVSTNHNPNTKVNQVLWILRDTQYV